MSMYEPLCDASISDSGIALCNLAELTKCDFCGGVFCWEHLSIHGCDDFSDEATAAQWSALRMSTTEIEQALLGFFTRFLYLPITEEDTRPVAFGRPVGLSPFKVALLDDSLIRVTQQDEARTSIILEIDLGPVHTMMRDEDEFVIIGTERDGSRVIELRLMSSGYMSVLSPPTIPVP